MRRFLAVLGLAVALTWGLPMSLQPAGAHADACAGNGFAASSAPHGYLALGAPFTTSAMFVNLVFGACATSEFWAYMELSGWCESTTGWGETSTGHRFTVTGSAYKFVLAGEVTGTISVYAEALVPPCVPEIGNNYRATSANLQIH